VARRGYRFAAEVTRAEAARPKLEANSRAGAARPPPRLSIVVLPIANLSGDPAGGISSIPSPTILTTDLSRISDSFAVACSTASTYKGRPVDVRQVGRELGVRYVLEGSVRRSGSQTRMNMQLIDAETGGHLWAERFETDR
jgi:TolB-like protein